MNVLNSVAHSNQAKSYLSYSQQLAEMEGRAKVHALDYESSVYERKQQKWQSMYDENGVLRGRRFLGDTLEGLDYSRTEPDEYFSVRNYEPVNYKIVETEEEVERRESGGEI